MKNFEEQIQKFEQDYENIKQKHYKEFSVLESDFASVDLKIFGKYDKCLNTCK